MKSQKIQVDSMISIAASGFLGTIAMAQTAPPKYTVVDLGDVGAAGGAFSIASNGLTSGASVTSGNKSHAVVLLSGLEFDMGAAGFGGTNSAAYGISENGQVVGAAQIQAPNGEDFCAFSAQGLRHHPRHACPSFGKTAR